MTLLSKQIGQKALNLIALAGLVGLLLLSFPVVSKASSHNSCSTSTKSIYSDFGNLDVESIIQTDEDGTKSPYNPFSQKTKEVLINNVVSSSTESVGDLTISFADDPGSGLDPDDQPGFFALTDCFNISNPSECKATSTLIQADDGIVPRKLTAQGGGSSPSDNTDTSDITMDAELGDRVELRTKASTNIGENANAHVQAGIDITDITLEMCEADDNGCGGNCSPTCDDDGTVNAGICVDGGVKIYVLDNDEDEDGDQLEITDVGIPTSNDDGSVNGTAAAFDDDSDGVKDAILYTPSDSPDTVTFDYTASDGNGGTDTAEVTVNVTGDGSSCGELTVRVEDPNGNLVPGVGFKPKYDEDNNGQPEQLPEKGLETGEFTYNVTVDDNPSLSKMNESLLGEIPDGFAESVDRVNKDLEKTDGQEEPDDFRYPLEELDTRKSKLATDPDGGDDGGGDNSPTASLECSLSQDQTFAWNCYDQHGNDAFAAKFDASGSTDPDNDIDTYDWTSQSGNIDETTDHPDADIQYCVNIASQDDTQDTVTVEVTDDEGNSDSDSGQIGNICPLEIVVPECDDGEDNDDDDDTDYPDDDDCDDEDDDNEGDSCSTFGEQACVSSSDCTWDGADETTELATFELPQDSDCAEINYQGASCPDGYERTDYSTKLFSCIPWDGGIINGDCQSGEPSPENGKAPYCKTGEDNDEYFGEHVNYITCTAGGAGSCQACENNDCYGE